MTDTETLEVVALLINATKKDILKWNIAPVYYSDGTIAYTTAFDGHQFRLRTGQGWIHTNGSSFVGDPADFVELETEIAAQQTRFSVPHKSRLLEDLRKLT